VKTEKTNRQQKAVDKKKKNTGLVDGLAVDAIRDDQERQVKITLCLKKGDQIMEWEVISRLPRTWTIGWNEAEDGSFWNDPGGGRSRATMYWTFSCSRASGARR